MTQRAISSFRLDEEGQWVASLSCGHRRHVRHQPPFELNEWVVSEAGRAAMLGSPLECRLCDIPELPEAVAFVRRSPLWTEETMPRGLLHPHRLAEGTWGRLVVLRGRLGFRMASNPPFDIELSAGEARAIPPAVEHEVRLLGPVEFALDFYAVRGPGVQD